MSEPASFPIVRTDAAYILAQKTKMRLGLLFIGVLQVGFGIWEYLYGNALWLFLSIWPWAIFISTFMFPKATQELRLDRDGVELITRKKKRRWEWGEISSPYKVTIGGGRDYKVMGLVLKPQGTWIPSENGNCDISPRDFGFTADELSSIITEGINRWGAGGA